MVLDRQGGPNWKENWCVAPVIVDIEKDEVYFTPIYYTLVHFSKFIRPGAKIIAIENNDETLMATAANNPDGSIAVVVFNEDSESKSFTLELKNSTKTITISGKAVQTIIVPKA